MLHNELEFDKRLNLGYFNNYRCKTKSQSTERIRGKKNRCSVCCTKLKVKQIKKKTWTELKKNNIKVCGLYFYVVCGLLWLTNWFTKKQYASYFYWGRTIQEKKYPIEYLFAKSTNRFNTDSAMLCFCLFFFCCCLTPIWCLLRSRSSRSWRFCARTSGS